MSAYYGRMGRGAARTLREQKRLEAEARNAANRRDCVTGKVRYQTEHDARVELVGALVAKNRGRNQRQECRAYLCPLCDGHHLTSSPLRPQTKETR